MDSNSGDDYYSDSMPAEAEQNEESEDSKDQSTALLPKSFFGGKELKPGAECCIKVEQVMEDQVAVSYSQHESSESPRMERDEEMMELMS